jgi:2-keto-4-pentenoate hydratase
MDAVTDHTAELILHARQLGTHFAVSDVVTPLISSAQAYAVQDRVAGVLWREHGGRPTCWKVGADTRDSVPTTAPMAPPQHASPATLSVKSLGLMVVEMELAYRFGSDLPPREQPYTNEEVADAVAAIHAAIEIVDTRLSTPSETPLADLSAAPALLKLADNLSNGAFVLGEGTKVWRKIDPRQQTGLLHINGKVHERFEVAHPLGNPWVLLPWFVAHLGKRADGAYGGVKAGDVVTTGSLNKLLRCKAGDEVLAEFPGIGSVTARFVV